MGQFDQIKYSNQYKKDHYDTVKVLLSKDEHLKDRIKVLADRENVSVNQWIIRAIRERLEWYE